MADEVKKKPTASKQVKKPLSPKENGSVNKKPSVEGTVMRQANKDELAAFEKKNQFNPHTVSDEDKKLVDRKRRIRQQPPMNWDEFERKGK